MTSLNFITTIVLKKRDEGLTSISRFCRMLATNYIGAFCLTKVLQPLLENSPVPSRVVNVTSFTHWSGKIWPVLTSILMHISRVHNSYKIVFLYSVFCLTFCFLLQFVAHRLTEKPSLENVL